MPYLEKVRTVHYTKGGKRVPKETKGAKKVVLKSRNWYGVFKEHGRVVARLPLSPDKRTAAVMLAELDKRREREGAGLINPFEADSLRPFSEHLTDYLDDLKAKERDAEYVRGVENTLNRVNKLCGFRCIADWKAERLEKFLNGLECSARRKNAYRGSLVAMANWLIQKRRLGANPFESVQPAEKQPERLRRALSVSDLQELLTVCRERPLNEVKTIRRGENKGKPLARINAIVETAKIRAGWERYLIYKSAVLTGLRRGELKELRPEHLTLNEQPELTLPGRYTKNKADAHIPLRNEHAEEIRQWIRATGKQPRDTLFRISDGRSAMDALRRDLRTAGIPYELNGKVFDWHCFRVQTSTLLTAARVHERIRQLVMRHADTNLTQHYDDDEHHWQAMREAVESLPMLTYQTPEQRIAESERLHDALEIMTEYGRELKSLTE